MVLIVTEKGDPSVGIFDRVYEIQCPFEREDVSDDDLITFKHFQEIIYSEFTDNCKLEYDFEIQQRIEKENLDHLDQHGILL